MTVYLVLVEDQKEIVFKYSLIITYIELLYAISAKSIRYRLLLILAQR